MLILSKYANVATYMKWVGNILMVIVEGEMTLYLDKKNVYCYTLLFLLCVSSIGACVGAIETPENVDPTKVINFLQDIFQIDTDRYEATLLKSSTRPWNDVDLTVGQYDLRYSGYDEVSCVSLTVTFNFWNSELIVCSPQRTSYTDNGVIHYTQKPDGDLRKAAIGVLQRYQTYTKDEQIFQMINLLNNADISDGYTDANGNLQLTVQVNENIYLTWSNTVNGAGYSRLNLGFKNGELIEFSDDRAFYSLGSDIVKISEEQAINIALAQVASLSYTIDDQVISDFDVVTEYILVQPAAMARPSESLLVRYPIWIVDLPLSDVYPGMASFIRVMLWTDTGEVISVQPLGAGFPNEYGDSAQMASSLQSSSSNSDNNTPLAVYVAAACLAIIIPLAITLIVLKRRNK
jgi:hypothetical protein